MITKVINKQIAQAMKVKDEVRLSTLRLLSSALHNAKIDKRGELTEEEELVVVKKEAKRRIDAIDAYEKVLRQASTKGGQAGLTKKIEGRIKTEKKELAILKEYLPEEMEESELVNLVNQAIKETGAKEMKDIGKVIGMVMQKAGGRADGGRVAAMVKSKLVHD